VLVWPGAGGTAATGPAAAEGPLGERGGKAVWAVVWSGMGILWFLPANRAGGTISGAISGAVSGEPGWLAHVQLSVAHALGNGGTTVAVVCAVLSFTGVATDPNSGPLLVLLALALYLDRAPARSAVGALSRRSTRRGARLRHSHFLVRKP
jgi:hypothetical protein